MVRELIGAVLAAGALAPALGAQQEARFVPVDRIAAIVGKTVIPYSRVLEEINVLRSQGRTIPTDSAALLAMQREVLHDLIDQELLVQAALADTAIKVTDQEVQAAADEAMREVRRQFASELDYQRQLRESGFATADEYRSWLAEQKRRDLLIERLREQLNRKQELTPLPPTERELRAAWEELRERQPARPAAVSFRQILIPVRPDSAALERAYLKAESVRVRLQQGEDFAAVARRFSDDPTTAQRGGELGWVRRGRLVKEFEDVAFRLRPGAISPPVRTTFGFHIIQVQRSTPAEIQVRHVLIRPEITEADRLEARTVAEAVARAARAGASFDSLARVYRDPEEQTLVENAPRDQLPPAYAQAMADAKPGDLIGPVVLEDQAGRVKYAVIRFDEARASGQYTFEEVRDRLRDGLAQENALKRYLDRRRGQTYIEIFPLTPPSP